MIDNYNTHTYTVYAMPTRTISITDEAYQKLKALKTSDKESFSEVILRYYPKRRTLSEVLEEIGDCSDLASSVGRVSEEMGRSRLRDTPL